MKGCAHRMTLCALALSTILVAVPVRAQIEEPDTFLMPRERWNQVFEYAACGAAIAFASGGVGVVAVVIACGRIINLYWSD